MKDLDFDELDRAVTSIMNGGGSKRSSNVTTPSNGAVSSNEGQATNPVSKPFQDVTTSASAEDTDIGQKERTLEIPSTLTDMSFQSAATSDSLSSSPLKSDVTSPASTEHATVASHNLQLPRRRQTPGRFMDMVRSTTASTPTRVSREGVAINTPEKVQSEQMPEEPKIDTDAAETVSGASTLLASTEIIPSESAGAPSSLVTPFLSDAKVEKRPLGFQEPPLQAADTHVSDPAHSLATSPIQTPVVSPGLPEQAHPEDFLPEEYQSDLMAVEANELTRSEPDPMPTPEEQIAPKNVPITTSPVRTEGRIRESVDIDHRLEPPHGAIRPDSTQSLTTSIPKQYSEAPSTGDKESGPIFDTTTYHQALSHPVKKKSGWMWIVWILLIIVLGAACGVALYFFAL